MNETESAKETVAELPKETVKETPKELKIQKFYKACVLIQNIFIVTTLIINLFSLGLFIKNKMCTNPQIDNFANIASFFLVTTLLINILIITVGIALHLPLNAGDKINKIYREKFIQRGIIGLLITITIFAVSIVVQLFSICIHLSTGLRLLE